MNQRPNLLDMSNAERIEALSGAPEAVFSLLLGAAENGHEEAQLKVGQLYLDGRGVDRDPESALRWFAAAATQGNAMGMNMVGRCCEHGWGTAIDKGLAAQWYGAAADHGLDWGMYNLATLCTLGEGVAEDRDKALTLFRTAADLGHAKSSNMIGSFYEDGWVVAANVEQAAEHYARAAEGGDFRGAFNHARMLVARGDIGSAGTWLAMMRETATEAFLEKARLWICEQEDAAWAGLRF